MNIICQGCGSSNEVPITEEEYQHWKQNQRELPLIQQHFSNLSADDRELVLSNTCPICWDEMWADPEEGYQ